MKQVRNETFEAIKQRVLEIPHRRFGTDWQSHIQGSRDLSVPKHR